MVMARNQVFVSHWHKWLTRRLGRTPCVSEASQKLVCKCPFARCANVLFLWWSKVTSDCILLHMIIIALDRTYDLLQPNSNSPLWVAQAMPLTSNSCRCPSYLSWSFPLFVFIFIVPKPRTDSLLLSVIANPTQRPHLQTQFNLVPPPLVWHWDWYNWQFL